MVDFGDGWLIIKSLLGTGGPDWVSVPIEGGVLSIWTSGYELRKLQVSWSRTPTVGVVQDADMCTFHFLNITGGDPDDTWTAGDFATVENAFDAFWNSLLALYSPETKLAEYLWRADGPEFRPHGTEFSPTLRVVAKSVAGTAVGGRTLPPQCALTVTEVTPAKYTAYGVGVPGHVPDTGRTQIRNRWGRFYLPAIMSEATTDGRASVSTCGTVATAVQTFYNACVAGQIVPVMYSPTTGSSWSITDIHVDDIIDVQRSRRYVEPTTRTPKVINQL